MSNVSEIPPELEEKLSELEILKQSLDQSRLKEKDIFNQLLKLGADFENFRKRNEKRIAEAREIGREEILLQMMSLADVLVQADSVTKTSSDMESIKKGLTLVRQQFEKFMREAGLEAIPSEGEKLDPLKHEAIAQEERSDVEEEIILSEIQRGYTLNGRVIRPARVRVAMQPSQLDESKDKEEEKHV